jgi:hypothetical protein
MTTTTTVKELGFVEVSGSLEPMAIAGEIAIDAHGRVGEMLALVDDWLRDDGRELNQKQRIELMSTALRCMDGFERATLDTLVAALSRIEKSGERDG